MGGVSGSVQRRRHGRKSIALFHGFDAGFMNSPAKCGAPNRPCNRERKMGLARA